MANWIAIKVRAILELERHDDKEVRILNRTVRWETFQIMYEGAEKHVHTRGMGFRECSGVLDIPVEEGNGGRDRGKRAGLGRGVQQQISCSDCQLIGDGEALLCSSLPAFLVVRCRGPRPKIWRL